MPFTLPGPPVLSDWADDDQDDDPLASLGLSDPAACGPTEPAGTRTRTPAGPTARPRFYSTIAVSALLGISVCTVRKMIAGGRLRAVKWGAASQSRWRVPADEIDRLGDAPPPVGDP